MPNINDKPSDHVYGVIGYGGFGRLLTHLLPAEAKKIVVSSKDLSDDLPQNAEQNDLNGMCLSADVIFICIPMSAYRDVLGNLKQIMNKDTILVDVASVKLEPQEIIQEVLPDHENILMTHPLFGPESAKGGSLEGFKFIVTDRLGRDSTFIEDIFEYQGCEIVEMTADEHDRQMSYTHSLTFFLAQALVDMNIENVELSAPSYQKLLALKDLEKHHTKELFDTIQAGNPHAKKTRSDFIDAITKIDQQIDENN